MDHVIGLALLGLFAVDFTVLAVVSVLEVVLLRQSQPPGAHRSDDRVYPPRR